MSSNTTRHIEGIADKAIGAVKKNVGAAIDNEQMEAEGKIRELEGEAKVKGVEATERAKGSSRRSPARSSARSARSSTTSRWSSKEPRARRRASCARD